MTVSDDDDKVLVCMQCHSRKRIEKRWRRWEDIKRRRSRKQTAFLHFYRMMCVFAYFLSCESLCVTLRVLIFELLYTLRLYLRWCLVLSLNGSLSSKTTCHESKTSLFLLQKLSRLRNKNDGYSLLVDRLFTRSTSSLDRLQDQRMQQKSRAIEDKIKEKTGRGRRINEYTTFFHLLLCPSLVCEFPVSSLLCVHTGVFLSSSWRESTARNERKGIIIVRRRQKWKREKSQETTDSRRKEKKRTE